MIRKLTDAYLRAVDEALPGFVERLYVVGSAALGARVPDASDVDTVIVTSRVASPGDLAALAKVHEGMPARPHLDGVYLDRATFDEFPVDRRVVPFVVDGEFRIDKPCGELTPVLWLTLRRYGIRVRGVEVDELGIPVDSAALRRYNLENLRDYWRPLATGVVQAVAQLPADTPVDASGVAWCVLGPARLHYTLAHEDITSKAGAATYLAETFPDWEALAHRAVRWRAGHEESFTAADLRAVARGVDAVVDDAWKRWGDQIAQA
ncbi:nucleotidyltransferase domain-containing protein [Micromonospora sp. 4G57]|uniref:Nucleotidyltransferase domain-containing protein n=1 Tax=Micromonospora sicca TaxID=2202420 RepID=A0ABU5J931_9ACTN|nr:MULTISPECIES: nucleotidyltransferase domain-containing protein [unclassified Micromonospora]MDZ5442285.1 nucleotidyltransferase domain-containing protein [Micromonospora sp. 4G57]MDZ5489090.1 nucleotidyltransferase domain-containing protein [Micromonospora sp. 4G53]